MSSLAVALAVALALAPVPIPYPAPTYKGLQPTLANRFKEIVWQRDLASDDRSGPMFCLLSDYDLGWTAMNSLKARGSIKVTS